ncbi:hypothetical protein [Pyrodictium abyssi]
MVLVLACAALLLALAWAPAAGAYMGVYSPGSSGFKRLVIYYGWLSTSNLPDIDVDVLVVAGTSRILPGGGDYDVVQLLRSRGVEVYAYLHMPGDRPVGLGSSFREMVAENTTGTLEERYLYWLSYIEGLVDRYVGVVDGVFLDECDPAYFTSSLDSVYVEYFTRGIGEIAGYAHSRGLKVFINGVMGYAAYGDYYLWEDYVVGYDPSAGGYYLIPGFLRQTSYTSPLEWVNGLSRYLYLAEHGLLDRTLAVTFADPERPETLEWARMAYALARIMGLGGWGYADIYYYAGGGPVPADIVEAREYGPPVSSPVIDEETQTAWRAFAASTVYVDYGSAAVDEALAYEPEVTVDGYGGEYWNILGGPVYGSATTLECLGMVPAGGGGLGVYAEWDAVEASSGGLLHVYIDSDGSAETGYSVYGVGADYLVEVYTDGTAWLYSYTGSGTDWSWAPEAEAPAAVVQTPDGGYAAELLIQGVGLEPGVSRIVVATVHGWADDAVAGPIVYIGQPLFYQPVDPLAAYTGVVEAIAISDSNTTIYATGPVGAVVGYTVVLPYTGVGGVDAAGAVVESYTWSSIGDGYIAVTVVAKHLDTSVKITIYPAQSTTDDDTSSGTGDST